MRLKSPLFAPGDSPRKIDKALASAADAVILDLEDSVAAPGKPGAREAVAARLRGMAGDPRLGDVIVRVNPRVTQWYLEDVAAIVPAGAVALMLPKCGGPEDMAALGHHLDVLEAASGCAIGSVQVIPIVTETAGSVFSLGAYGPVAARIAALCFGAEDISADLGVAPRRADGAYNATVSFARAQVLAAAASLGVPAIDTPWPDPRDPEGLRRESETAAIDGFAGKILIHPDQIAIVNEVFTPPPEQVRWAERVRDHFVANPDSGVFALDGKMIDRPHHRLALRILAAAGR